MFSLLLKNDSEKRNDNNCTVNVCLKGPIFDQEDLLKRKRKILSSDDSLSKYLKVIINKLIF